MDSSTSKEFRHFRAIISLFDINRRSRDKIIKLNVSTYPGGLEQLVDDLYSIYPG